MHVLGKFLSAFALFCGCVLLSTSVVYAQSSNTWSSAGQLIQSRTGAAAVMLSDGRVLITGGSDSSGIPAATAEIFDPSTGQFVEAPPMNVPRTNHAAVLLNSGDVLVTGGLTTGGGFTDTIEIFSASAQQWTLLPASLGSGLSKHAVAKLSDGNILIVGGETTTGPVSSILIYRTVDQSISSIGSLITAREDAAAAATPDGRVLIVGGIDINGSVLTSTELFVYNADSSIGTVSAGPNLTYPRTHATATSTYDGVAVIGGNNGSVDVGAAEIFSQWTSAFRVVNGGTPRSSHFAVLLPNNGAILTTGGTGGSSVDLLQPWANSTAGAFFSAAASLSNHTGGFAAPASLGALLAAGGTGTSANAAELYWFPTISTDQADYPPGTPVVMTGVGFRPGETVNLYLREYVNQMLVNPPDYTVTADKAGTFTFMDYAPTPSDLGARYHLTASGTTSGLQAQTIFTDSNPKQVTIGAQSPSPVPAGGSANYTVNVTNAGNNNACVVQLSVSGLPGGVTTNFPQNISVPSSSGVTLTITTPPALAPSPSYSFTVSGSQSSGSCNGSGPTSSSGTLAVSAPVATTTLINAPSISYGQSGSVQVTVNSSSGTPTGSVSLSFNGGGSVSRALSGGTYTFTSADIAGLGLPNAGSYSLTVSYTAQNGFGGSSANGALTVDKVTASVTPNPASKTYGTADPALTGALSGFLAADNVTAAYARTAGETVAGGPYTISATLAPAGVLGNYNITYNTALFTINKANASVTPNAASKTYGAIDPPLTGTLTGFVAGDNVTATYSRVAGETVAGGPYSISAMLSPAGVLGNYAITYNTASFTISQTDASIVVTPYSVTYDANPHTATATAMGVAGADLIAGVNLTGTIHTNAGTYLGDSWSFHDSAGNYKDAGGTVTDSIAQAPASVSLSNLNQTYTGSALAPIITVVPLVGVGITYTGIDPTVYPASSTAPTDPGSYSVVVVVADPNYVGGANGTLVINKADPALNLALESGSPEPSPYGTRVYFDLATTHTPRCPTGTVNFYADYVDSNSQPASTITLDGSNCTQPIVFSTATLSPTSGQPHAITAVYSGDTYFLGTISKAVQHNVTPDGTAVTLATTGTSVYVGDSITFTATVAPVSGIDGSATPPAGTVQFNEVTVDGDGNVTSTISTLGTGVLSATAPYASTFGYASLGAGIHYVQAVYLNTDGLFMGSSSAVGVETVNRIVPTITWQPQVPSIVYGTPLSTDQLNATAADTHNSINPIPGTLSYDSPLGTILPVGDKNVKVTFTPDDTAKYESQTATTTITVTPATLTVTADDQTRTYGAADPTFTFQYKGFVNSENETIVTTAPTCSTTATSSNDVGKYDITCSGGAATNYSFNYVKGTLTVDPAPLTVTADNQSKTYDGAPFTAFTVSYSGFVNGQDSSALGGSVVFSGNAVGATDAGSYTITPGGFTSGNYTITFNNGTLNIQKADSTTAITVAGGTSFTYDGNAHPATVAVTGAGGLSLTPNPVYSCGHAPLSAADTGCTASYNYAGDTNHNPSSDSKTYTISKADPVVTAIGGTFTYDATQHLGSGTATGVKSESLAPVSVIYKDSGNNLLATAPVNAGTYSVAALYAGDSDYNQKQSAAVSLIINRANPAVSLSNLGPYTYDGATHSASAAAIGVDGHTEVGGSFAITYNGSASSPVNAHTYAVHAAFTSSDSNYNDAISDGSLTINKADSTTMVTVAGGTSFTYDSNSHLAAVTVTGAGALSLTPDPLYSCGHAPLNVADSGCIASYNYAGDTNHNPSSDSKTYSISKATSATTLAFENGPYTYRGSAFAATAQVSGVGGLSSVVAVVYSGDCLNVTGANGCTGTATFPGDSNHDGSSDTKSITINKATSTTTLTFENGPYTYRGLAFAATAQVSGVGGLSSVVAVVYSGDCLNVTGANGCIGTATFAGDGNHDGSSDTKSITISKATSTTTLTFENGPYTYRGSAFTANAQVSGVGGLSSVVAVVYSGDCLNVTSANGCTGTATFAGDGNHDGSSDTKSITINQAAASVTPNPAGKTYGTNDPALTGTLTGFIPGDRVSAVYSRTTGESVAGGPYTISATLSPTGVLGNYAITYNMATFTISRAKASVTPNALSKTYGSGDPTLTGSLTGFLPGDAVTATYNRTHGETVAGGPYTISAVLSPASVLGNYDITNNTGSFTIDPAPLAISVSGTQVYGGSGQMFTATKYVSFVNSDASTVLSGSLACGTSALATSPVGNNYAVNGCSGLSDSNYTITYVSDGFTVTKAPLIVTAANQTKTYGQTFPLSGGSSFFGSSGLQNGETIGSVSLSVSNNGGTATASVSGSYTITPSAATGGNFTPSNYAISYATGTLTVTPAPVTVTASSATVYFGDPIPAITPSFAGFVNGEMNSVLTTQPTCSTKYTIASAVGTTPTTNCSGASAVNYTFNYVPGSVTIRGWTATGFYSPVAPTPIGATGVVWNAIKGGSTVPLKFNIYAGGVQKTSTAAVQSDSVYVYQAYCGMGGIINNATDILTDTGATALRYDATGQQFIQNWKTPKGAGGCYVAQMIAADGTMLQAYFTTN